MTRGGPSILPCMNCMILHCIIFVAFFVNLVNVDKINIRILRILFARKKKDCFS